MAQPWYESTLLWGAFGLAFAIVLAVVGVMVKDLRWLLFVSEIPFIVAACAAFRSVRRRGLRYSVITCVSILILCGLAFGYVKLQPAIGNVSALIRQEKPLVGSDRASFVKVLDFDVGPRDKIQFACAEQDESACAKAARYLIAFSEANWPLEADTVRRMVLPLPTDGVVMVSRSQQPPGVSLPPHMGWWSSMDKSQQRILAAFGSMNIDLKGSADPNLAADALILYFGPAVQR